MLDIPVQLDADPMPAAPPAAPPRRRILLAAYACIPWRGSEPGMGWNRAVDAARHFDTWVLCRESLCAAGIEAYLDRHGPVSGLHFVFVPESRFERLLERIPGMMYLAYNLWNRRAFRIAKRLHERCRFSLVHQVTFSGFREPGYLWKLDAPFVWGPLGGAQNYPWRFLPKAGPAVAVREAVRNVLNAVQLRFSLRVRRAARRAALLMAATTTNQEAIAQAHAVEPVLFPETGVRSLADAVPTPPSDGTLRILWCGVLEPRKALHLLLEALEKVPPGAAWELHVVGSGPMRGAWERLARARGIASRVRWLGSVSHQDSLAQFAWADVFVFTSLRDTTGTVLHEALAAGLPVVCLDHQGAGDLIDSTCGIKIPVTRPRDVVAALAHSIELLGTNRQLREQLGRGARQRVVPYLWERQGERLAEMYRSVIAASEAAPPRPETGHDAPGHDAARGRIPSNGNGAAPGEEPDGRAAVHAGAAPKTESPAARLGRSWGRGTRAGVLALADQAIVSGVRFLTAMVLGRLGGAGELGAYTLAFSLMLAALAVQDALILGPYIVFGNRLKGSRRSAYMGSVFLEAGTLATFALGAFSVAALVLYQTSPASALAGTMGVLGVALPFILLHQLGRRFAFAELDLRTAILLDAASGAVQVVGLGLLAATGALSAPAVFGLAGLAGALPGLGWAMAKCRRATIRWHEVSGDLRANWRLGRWMLASQLTSVAGIYAAGWLLAFRMDLHATGIYAACASIVCLTNPILLGFNNVLFPRAALAFAEGGRAEVRRVSRRAMGLLTGLMGLAAVALIAFGQYILAAAYGPGFAEYHHVIAILAVATMLSAAAMAAEQGLLALERSDIAFAAQFCAVGTACVGSFALIPPFGVVGAALGPLVGSAVAASILLAANERLTRPACAERGMP